MFTKIKSFVASLWGKVAAIPSSVKAAWLKAGSFLAYVKNRFKEKSTIAAIAATVPTCAVLPQPWSLIALLIGTIVVLVPDTPKAS